MKALSLLVLIFVASAIQDNEVKQGDFDLSKVVDTLKSSSLGRAILTMASLQSKSQQVEYSKLFDAIEELELSMQESRGEENQQYQEAYTQYVSDSSFYPNQVTQYTNEVASHQVVLSEVQDSQASNEKRLENKRDELAQYQKLRNTLSTQMLDSSKVFDQQSNDYTEAISALDQATEYINQLKQGSFIELGQINVVLQQRLGNLQTQRFMYEPLIEALVEISQEKLSDQKLVAQVITLLNQLREYLNASKITLINQYNAEQVRNIALANEYDTLISNLQDITIPETQQNIENNQSEIKTIKKLLDDATENLRLAAENVEAVETAWVQRTADNNDLIKRYTDELATIAQAKTALERGGIKKP